MASNDLYSSAEIPAEIQEYLQDFERLQQQTDWERGRNELAATLLITANWITVNLITAVQQ
jgi:hypothetical protein